MQKKRFCELQKIKDPRRTRLTGKQSLSDKEQNDTDETPSHPSHTWAQSSHGIYTPEPINRTVHLDDPDAEIEVPDADVHGEAIPSTTTLPADDLRKKRAAANQLRGELTKRSKEAKSEAKEDWQRHLLSSTSTSRVSAPVINHEAFGEYTAKALCDVHSSHEVWAFRKVVFCTRCGYYKELKSEKLREPCIGRPPHSNNVAQLSRLHKGLHPKRIEFWSDGFNALVSVPPIKLRGRSTES